MVLERATGKVTALTETLDRPVQSFIWSPDSNVLFFTVSDRGRQSVQMIPRRAGQPASSSVVRARSMTCS